MSSASEFIRVDVDMTTCVGIAQCGGCVRVCPVGIFQKNGDKPAIVEKNLDDLARLLPGTKEVSCSAFGQALVEHM